MQANNALEFRIVNCPQQRVKGYPGHGKVGLQIPTYGDWEGLSHRLILYRASFQAHFIGHLMVRILYKIVQFNTVQCTPVQNIDLSTTKSKGLPRP